MGKHLIIIIKPAVKNEMKKIFLRRRIKSVAETTREENRLCSLI